MTRPRLIIGMTSKISPKIVEAALKLDAVLVRVEPTTQTSNLDSLLMASWSHDLKAPVSYGPAKKGRKGKVKKW